MTWVGVGIAAAAVAAIAVGGWAIERSHDKAELQAGVAKDQQKMELEKANIDAAAQREIAREERRAEENIARMDMQASREDDGYYSDYEGSRDILDVQRYEDRVRNYLV